MKFSLTPKNRDSIAVLPYDVSVLRLGHRLVRDERISTHIGLVSRAFGAKKLYLTGADDHTIESIRRLTQRWGGEFAVEYTKEWRRLAENWDGLVVHLTMYGQLIDSAIPKINRRLKKTGQKKLMVIVGAEKVPAEIYSMADYNVAVGNQPHSEVAALAVFLDRLFMGAEMYIGFVSAKIKITPANKRKKVLISDEN